MLVHKKWMPEFILQHWELTRAPQSAAVEFYLQPHKEQPRCFPREPSQPRGSEAPDKKGRGKLLGTFERAGELLVCRGNRSVPWPHSNG